MQRALAAAILASLISGASAGAALKDPPRIVEWHLVGNVGLGMSRERIEYVYGYRIPRDPSAGFDFATYHAHGGTLMVNYTHGFVSGVTTTTPYYRTRGGFGVGSRIPLGSCHKVNGQCVRRWQGFTLSNGGRTWLHYQRRGKRTVEVQAWVEHGVVETLTIQYNDRYEPGFNAD